MPYFINSQVFFTYLPFYIVFDDLVLGWSTHVQIHKNKGPWLQRNYIIAKEQKRDEYGESLIQSSPGKKTHAHHKTHLHTMKVYKTRQVIITIGSFAEVSLTKIHH